MAKIEKRLGKGNVQLDQLGAILHDIVDDLAALKTAIENHQHVENSAATYTQNASVAKTAYAPVVLKSTKKL